MIRATIDTSILAPSIRRIGQPRNMLTPIMRAWVAEQYEGVRIVSAREFLAILDAEHN